MLNFFIIFFGKLSVLLIRFSNLGGGSTWPGHLALKLNKRFIEDLTKDKNIVKIVIAGTNGKTTTGKLLSNILKESGRSVAHNMEGANLLNGLASTVLINSDLGGKLNKKILIFESDENAFPKVVEAISPDFVILLNLFRDQMDRYGEIDTIATNWKEALKKLEPKSKIILNADDPAVSYLGEGLRNELIYFGLNHGKPEPPKHGADSIYCPNCYNPLSYKFTTFSHLGDWYCERCGLKRPTLTKIKNFKSSLSGQYNRYNVLAATIMAKKLGINDTFSQKSLLNFKAAFGRQEKIKYQGHQLQLFLSKNPTSFNESLQAISDLNARNILIVLNDRIPDGLDVSWIWDIDTSLFSKIPNVMVTGDRVFDMSLRLRYSDISFDYERDLRLSLEKSLLRIDKNELLYVLPTYSAMLDLRKILKGRKLL